ncbi:MAG: glycosyltransferase [Candidatus Omnitrophica bacterium]|nr:glycosyltransferase [Candidatus Omnitrophota bacterium]
MNKINVLHLVEDLKVGGLEKNISAIALGIDKAVFDVHVWCLVRGGKIFEELKANGIKTENLKMRSHRDVFFFMRLCGKLRRCDIKVIHLHGYSAAVVGRMAAVVSRVPVVIRHVQTTHDHYPRKKLIIERILGFFTDKIICCSMAVGDSVIRKEKIPPSKIEVIYNGIDLDKFKVRGDKIDKYKDVFRIGCIASLFAHKGHVYLIDAIKKVIDRYGDNLKLVLIGDGVLRSELERHAAKLNMQEHVEFKGVISDIPGIIYTLDVVVLPSLVREGLGLAIIEAMACGRPVIGTNIGGIPELIREGENGLLVPPKDADALSKAIGFLLKNREKAALMGKKGREIAEEKFSSGSMIKKIEGLYLGLL